jgi:serine protease DegQ
MRKVFPGLIVGQSQQLQSSLGSGVIARPDGYVLTNNHVIQGADAIEAILSDGRAAKATIVGTDPETDLAVLKIDADNLPTIAIADGRSVNVGDVVLAIGNPFGLGNTVTMGIVSALGRLLPHKSAYEDFIQTDAAINQGNSGGALVNANGELLGINSDVLSLSGGSVGIGFAIPVATAKTVLEQIIADGKVIRGWIGAEYIDLPPHDNGTPGGVMIRGVYEKGPAAEAGLQGGDVLLKLNNEPIMSQFELRNREANLAPGTKVQLSGLRNGKPFALELTLAERPQLPQGSN